MNVLDILKQFGGNITAEHLIYLTGLILLGIWLLKTSWGRKALADSPPRRNNMPLYLPFIPLLIWFGVVGIAMSITKELLADLPDWQGVFLDNLILCLGATATMGVIILLVKRYFARRLKGFGLEPKTIYKDFLAGLVNLLSVYPLVIVMIILTLVFGKLIQGPQFQIRQHEELELIKAHSQLSVRVLIFITAVVIVPAFEEMLFRGLFQTTLRSFLSGLAFFERLPNEPLTPWAAIAISSALFAMAHYEPTHWPPLFVLGVCLGYSYEKSGSLFRPIFIHSLFNAISIIATLNQ